MVLLRLLIPLTLGCICLGHDRSKCMKRSSKPWGFLHSHYTYPMGFISGYVLPGSRVQTSWLNTCGLELSQRKLSHEGLLALLTRHSLSCCLKCHMSLFGKWGCHLSGHIHVPASVVPCWVWTAFVARCVKGGVKDLILKLIILSRRTGKGW